MSSWGDLTSQGAAQSPSSWIWSPSSLSWWPWCSGWGCWSCSVSGAAHGSRRIETSRHGYNCQTSSLTMSEPSCQAGRSLLSETRSSGKRLHKAAIMKHIHPACNSDSDAIQFSTEREKHMSGKYATEVNHVFKINPNEFIEARIDRETVRKLYDWCCYDSN